MMIGRVKLWHYAGQGKVGSFGTANRVLWWIAVYQDTLKLLIHPTQTGSEYGVCVSVGSTRLDELIAHTFQSEASALS